PHPDPEPVPLLASAVVRLEGLLHASPAKAVGGTRQYSGAHRGPPTTGRASPERRKSVKCPSGAPAPQSARAILRPASPQTGSRWSSCLPQGDSTHVERFCGIRMSVAAFEPTAHEVWSRVVERAREELPSSSFNMWFSRIRPTELRGDILRLVAPSDFVRDWLARHYLDLIQA